MTLENQCPNLPRNKQVFQLAKLACPGKGGSFLKGIGKTVLLESSIEIISKNNLPKMS